MKRKKNKKKKTNRRSNTKNAALDPKYTLKSRLDLLDFDYLDKLNDKDLAFLAKFAEEEIHASFSDNNKENLNKTDEEKRVIYNRNNARNADVLTRKKTRKQLAYVGDKELERIEYNPEDALISYIDKTKK
jgi:hypothetical protein